VVMCSKVCKLWMGMPFLDATQRFCMGASLRSHVFAAHRQVGETNLNDVSSRSHQIVRLVSLLIGLSLFAIV
jgi:hypothetical protein